MWPANYFAPRYWNGHYWAKIGEDLTFTTVDMGTLYVMETFSATLEVMETFSQDLNVMETLSSTLTMKADS